MSDQQQPRPSEESLSAALEELRLTTTDAVTSRASRAEIRAALVAQRRRTIRSVAIYVSIVVVVVGTFATAVYIHQRDAFKQAVFDICLQRQLVNQYEQRVNLARITIVRTEVHDPVLRSSLLKVLTVTIPEKPPTPPDCRTVL